MTISVTPHVSEDGFLETPKLLPGGGYLIACKRISPTLTVYIQATSPAGGSWSVVERIHGVDRPHPPELNQEDAYETYLEIIRTHKLRN